MERRRFLMSLASTLILSALMFTGCTVTPVDKNKDAEVLKTITEFNLENVTNKAVLIVREGEKLPAVEKTLKDFSDKYNIDVVKVEYNDSVERFVRDQEQVIAAVDKSSMTLIYDKIEQVPADFKGDNTQRVNGVYSNIDSAVKDYASGKICEGCIEYIQKNSTITKDEMINFLNSQKQYDSVALETPIFRDDLPMLILFDYSEKARIKGFPQEREKLDWYLITKGILSLSKDETLKEITKWSEEKKNFVAVFGSNTCPYCYGSAPVIEEVMNEKKITYKYVDVNTTGNLIFLQEYYSKGYIKSSIESTPTIIYFKEGKEVDRITGEKSRAQLRQFITQSMSK